MTDGQPVGTLGSVAAIGPANDRSPAYAHSERAAEPDDAVFEWLSQRVEGNRRELSELVEEEHTTVRKC